MSTVDAFELVPLVPRISGIEKRLRWVPRDSRTDADYVFEQGLFNHRSYLRENGFGNPVFIRRPGLQTPALFAARNDCLYYLGRLDEMSAAQIDDLSQQVFRTTGYNSVMFEDISLKNTGQTLTSPHTHFYYQNNWRRKLGPDETYLTSKQASNVRRRMRRLQEEAGGAAKVRLQFGRCKPGDIDAISDLNRIKIERKGRRYQLNASKKRVFEEVAKSIGYTSCLYVGDKLIAGTLIFIVNGRAFFTVVGYDLDYAKFGPGIQVYVEAVRELEKLGCREANFLWGDSKLKSDLGAVRDPLSTLVIRRNGRALLSHRYWKSVSGYVKDGSKRWVKEMLRREALLPLRRAITHATGFTM